MKAESGEVFYSVPVRRTLWPGFLVGAAALVGWALPAAALCGLLLLSSVKIDGAVIIIMFGVLWGGGFFFSVPWQRRCTRSLDARRPGIRLADGVLAVPLDDDTAVRFMLEEPHELRFGWAEDVVATAASPTMHTRTVLTYAALSQAGRYLFLKAEDSVRPAQAAGWPKGGSLLPTEPAVRLWASDLVALVEAMRTRPR